LALVGKAWQNNKEKVLDIEYRARSDRRRREGLSRSVPSKC